MVACEERLWGRSLKKNRCTCDIIMLKFLIYYQYMSANQQNQRWHQLNLKINNVIKKNVFGKVKTFTITIIKQLFFIIKK